MTHSSCEPDVILYDGLQVNGGAEAVTLLLAELYPSAQLCVGFVSPDFAFERGRPANLHVLGPPRRSVFARQLGGLRNFRRCNGALADAGLALFSGTLSPVAVRQRRAGHNVLYCHTIPRFAYDLRDYWRSRAAWWQRPVLAWLSKKVRREYEAAFGHMDLVIANSENVRARIRRYLGAESVVIHPPCDTDGFQWLGQDDYYLSNARLEPFKRVSHIVQAFLEMPQRRLVVTSGGSELDALRRLAADAPNIRFTGWLPKDELQALVGRAIATLHVPLDEDFGMAPVESMAAGKPVIGVAEGGLLETVVPEETGMLIAPEASVADIKRAVEWMSPARALSMRAACERRATLFSREVFAARLAEALAGLGDGKRAPGSDSGPLRV